ncbi:MAG: type II toxin-antitoxin system HipA family toxin [Paramuribaculum sp.]|nr:type II toxin-antitoxin system HipA family toxin [Paramuribaculum sp.]MDE6303595.1 type II toxin-antitoxin system HipA family toxin [Paramuribaculum sp.]
MKRTEKIKVMFHEQNVGVLSLSPDNRLNVFEYDRSWLADGFSISPLELPLKSGIFIAKPHPFYGNFGIFEDSLPDGYGRYLLHKALLRNGINDSDLSSLDRLALVGNNGMGALTYSPYINLEYGETVTDFDRLQAIALEVLKERQDKDAGLLLYNSGNSGGARPKAVFSDEEGHWIVKFRHIYDPKDIGIQEARYNEAARRCGIIVPDFRLVNGRYFTSRRFDIDPDGNRIHTATAGGLLCISLHEPFMDYSNLLALTGYLTQNHEDVEQMYRRMVFNYLTDNKDDHCKNFSFYVIRDLEHGTWKWRLAPAYDLTLCTDGYNGEHATSVNGTGNPRLSDFIAVGKKIKLSVERCNELIEEVRGGCRELIRYEIK